MQQVCIRCSPLPADTLPAAVHELAFDTIAGQFAIAPEDLNPDYYTHPLYAFAYIDPDTFFVEYADNELDKFVMSRFTSTLKNGNPCVHPMISVGGAAFTAADATRSVWSSMISRRSSRTAFITSAIAKARKFGFAGIDLVRVLCCRSLR